ncbi:hypothetical protein RhiirC2_771495 [Rhizophagus irregularis]|uniref:Uncharacterized protein n=1 Tax=Rhizophagus irregularis TaxID=588596 RepID=A0A2N1NTS5_9GLOM|nr:hypothetical protein RhiirC2_771495 [Rhizophagus irregularis]
MLSRVKKQKEPRVCLSVLHFDLDQWTYQIYRKTSLTLNATSESVVKAGKVEISIKRGQKSELSIYDEAAGKSTKSQIPSNALKRIEPRVWSLDDFEMGSPLGVSLRREFGAFSLLSGSGTRFSTSHLIGNPKRELDIREAISFLEKEDIKFWKHLKKTKHKHPISISSLEKSIFEYKDAAFPEPKQRNRLELTRGLN